MTTTVERVCAAILRADSILMVRHVHDGRDYWTLPGGGAEAGESAEQACLREVEEEVVLRGEVERLLYERSYRGTTGADVRERCFLVRVSTLQQPVLGHDPELGVASPMLVGVSWFPLDTVADDRQVARVIQALHDG